MLVAKRVFRFDRLLNLFKWSIHVFCVTLLVISFIVYLKYDGLKTGMTDDVGNKGSQKRVINYLYSKQYDADLAELKDSYTSIFLYAVGIEISLFATIWSIKYIFPVKNEENVSKTKNEGKKSKNKFLKWLDIEDAT